MKKLLAKAIAALVKDGDMLGIGSGSTVELALEGIGRRIQAEKLNVRGITTSRRSAELAAKLGIAVIAPAACGAISWAFDGADEVDPQFNLIKGRWGAMLNEKIVAKRAGGVTVVVSEEKLVPRLGVKFPIPIEVIQEAVPDVESELRRLGAAEVTLRSVQIGSEKLGPVYSEHGNFILDARFAQILPELELRIKAITGVVESGLFVGMTKEVLVARPQGVWRLTRSGGKTSEELVVPADQA